MEEQFIKANTDAITKLATQQNETIKILKDITSLNAVLTAIALNSNYEAKQVKDTLYTISDGYNDEYEEYIRILEKLEEVK